MQENQKIAALAQIASASFEASQPNLAASNPPPEKRRRIMQEDKELAQGENRANMPSNKDHRSNLVEVTLKGTVIYPEGSIYKRYEGPLVGGVPQGFGRMFFANGEIFVGMFENGLRNGPGTLNQLNDVTLKGTWVNDKMEGEGEILLPGGGV